MTAEIKAKKRIFGKNLEYIKVSLFYTQDSLKS